MRFAGNFHPEWGYLAPAPSFLRTARIVIVATAVGATAGAGVVFALVDRPSADAGQASVAARTLAPPAAAPAPIGGGFAQSRSEADKAQSEAASAAAAAAESRPKSTSQPPAAIGALAEVPAANAVRGTDVHAQVAPLAPASAPAAAPASMPAAAPAPKKIAKKHHYYPRYPVREAARREAPPPSGARQPFSFDRLFNYGGDAPRGEYFADDAGRGFFRDSR